MKIDNSWLQAGVLAVIGAVALTAAAEANWSVVGVALAGLFAALNVHPKPPGA
jgi:hypothetical protein